MKFNPSPSYKHDCEECEFLTSASLLGRVVDIYIKCNVCGHSKEYIIRCSNEPSDYMTTFKHSPERDNDWKYVSGWNHNETKQVLALNQFVCEHIDNLVQEMRHETN